MKTLRHLLFYLFIATLTAPAQTNEEILNLIKAKNSTVNRHTYQWKCKTLFSGETGKILHANVLKSRIKAHPDFQEDTAGEKLGSYKVCAAELYFLDINQWHFQERQIEPARIDSRTDIYNYLPRCNYQVNQRDTFSHPDKVTITDNILYTIDNLAVIPEIYLSMLLAHVQPGDLQVREVEDNLWITIGRAGFDSRLEIVIHKQDFSLRSLKKMSKDHVSKEITQQEKRVEWKSYDDRNELQYTRICYDIVATPIQEIDLSRIEYRLPRDTSVDISTEQRKEQDVNSNDLLADPAFQP